MKYLIFLIIFLLIPQVHAWGFNTHKNIIEYVYFNLPLEVQHELNLTRLKEGSIMPDLVFQDTTKHHYPYSLTEAKRWLNNDSDLSLNICIAAHYITDSFAAPHNIFGENYKDHATFEKQVGNYYPISDCGNYNFKLEDLKVGTANSKDWYIWLKTKDVTIPQREIDQATKFLMSIVMKKLNATCIKQTKTYEVPYFTIPKIILISIVSLIGLYFLKK